MERQNDSPLLEDTMKILLVEDDEILVASLTTSLASQNYTVEAVTDGQLGWDYACSTQYDLIVLDVNLPGLDGISLCRKLRQANYQGPILLLTAKGDSHYKVSGLDAGADDYVVKPCPLEELSARIRALLRRPREASRPVLQWGDLRLDPSSCQVFFAEKLISLSPKEYGLLELFLRNPQRVFSTAMLLERLWGFDEIPGEDTIRSHIKRLRRKLKQVGAAQVIENIYGMGYRLDTSSDHPEPVQLSPADYTSPSHEASSATDGTTQAAARAAAVAALGQFSDVIANRLAILDEAATQLQTATLPETLRQRALQAAHKLTGSLGMFGLTDCSNLSRAIESGLEAEPKVSDRSQICTWIVQLRQEMEAILDLPQSVAIAQAVETPSAPPSVPSVPPSHPEVNAKANSSAAVLLWIAPNSDLVATIRAINPGIFQIIQTTPADQEPTLPAKPDIIVLDLSGLPDWDARLACLQDFSNRYPDTPILVLTHEDSFQHRLEIARHGGCSTCLSRFTPASKIWDSILKLYRYRRPSPFRILAVDDDPIVLKTLEHQLSLQGMEITTLSDPHLLWEALPHLQPDLLMLDVEMPQIEGIELCKVIRSDPQWNYLPILFLTARRDEATIRRMYLAGADDYVAKPFTEPELVTRILNRIHRSRLVQPCSPS